MDYWGKDNGVMGVAVKSKFLMREFSRIVILSPLSLANSGTSLHLTVFPPSYDLNALD